MKKGYYLILDSFIAIVILLIGIFLITSLSLRKPEQAIAKNYAQDVISFMAFAKINDLCNACACGDATLSNLCLNSKIGNLDNTIIELIGELHSRNEKGKIKQLIESLIVGNAFVPNKFGFSFILHESADYEYYPTLKTPPDPDSTSDTTNSLMQSKKIIFGFWEDGSGNINYWGPYTIEARIWQI